jgi:hypothetical protein
MTHRIRAVVLLTALAGGCTWVKLSEAGAGVRLATPDQVAACERIGMATATTEDRVLVARNETKVKGELITLASNQAATIGGNTIVAQAPPDKGIQTFIVYRCP